MSQSLRSGPKRGTRLIPKISGPLPQQIPGQYPPRPGTSGSATGPPPGIPESARRKTSELVKRRYSTRINGPIPNFDPNAPPIPQLPRPSDGLPAQPWMMGAPPGVPDTLVPGARGGRTNTLDMEALQDPSLHASQYVTDALSNASDEDIRAFETMLRQQKGRTLADLQQNLVQNRTQFIKISKEAEKLKDEMESLRGLMSDLKTNTLGLRSDANAASDREEGISGFGTSSSSLSATTGMPLSKKDRRSSVADRSVLWHSQMQALYKNVEGSQKFLPTQPGRHVIQNAGPWIELDNATYKSRRAMQIFLLNDHLLIASRKKRKTNGPDGEVRGQVVKLVADRCWPLLDIEIVDMASSIDSQSVRGKLADAVMIRGVGQDSFLYRTEKPCDPEKQTLLLNIRKAVEEVRKGLQSELEATNKAKEAINYFAARDPGLLQKAELLETLSDIKDVLIEVGDKQRNLRWVESQMDKLDITIALQDFQEGVALVEELREIARNLRNNQIAQDFINFKVEERCAKLTAIIIRELEADHANSAKTKQHVNWLTRLGVEDRARETYLEARSQLIQKRSRQCIFQGDLVQYIWEVSYVYFQIIRNTVACFQLCFPPMMMSVCVKWAKEQVDAFNVILARQLSGVDEETDIRKACVQRAQEHAKLLQDVSLDFKNAIMVR